MFFWTDVTVTAVHIIVGALMIADGLSGIAAILSASKNGISFKDKTFSVIANTFSVVIGAAFILLAWNTAELSMILCGVVMIVKGLMDLYIMLRNREFLSSVKGTFNEIKNLNNK